MNKIQLIKVLQLKDFKIKHKKSFKEKRILPTFALTDLPNNQFEKWRINLINLGFFLNKISLQYGRKKIKGKRV